MKRPSIGTRLESILLAGTAIGGVRLSGGVVACMLYVLLTLASVVTVQSAFAQSAPVAPGVQLEAGIEKEDVDGDLKSAMAIYEKIAADTSAPRDVRAKALLRLAGCDEKLGKQAKQVYEQIVHDYADMPAAAQARKQLALLKQQEHPALPATLTARKINWRDLGEVSVPDTDGERTVFEADFRMNIGDLARKNKQTFFKIDPDHYPRWSTSRDLSTVLLLFDAKPGWPGRAAAVKTDGTGYREVFRDDAQEKLRVAPGFSVDWSWDNRYFLLSNPDEGEGGHILIVNALDGERRELVRTDSGKSDNAKFSPDGQFVAYEIAPGPGRGGNSSVFIVAATGGEPREVYKSYPRPDPNPTAFERWTLRDWTSDGRYLLIADSHFGKSALYLLPVHNGKATGAPIFVRYGDVEAGHSTATGAFVYMDETTKPVGADVYLTSLGPPGRVDDWRSLALRGGLKLGPSGFGYDPEPFFSPDGSHLVYKAGDDEPAFMDLMLRDLPSGQERVLYRSAGDYLQCRYSNHLRKIYCVRGKDNNSEATELISLDEHSAEAELLGSFDERISIRQVSQDDRSVYLVIPASNPPLVRWDLSTHKTAVPAPVDALETDLISSDERWLLRKLDHSLAIRPLSGGDWTTLVPNIKEDLPWFKFSADSKSVLFATRNAEFKLSLFRISIAGGKPEHLADMPNRTYYTRLYLSPDESQIIDVAIDFDKYDLWVLDNFEPSAKK
jgi:hypothetical protein